MTTLKVKSGDVVSAAMAGVTGPHVLPGIPFGSVDQLLTPAYWQRRCAEDELLEHGYFTTHSGTLAEEVGFCILGGFGVSMELSEAAFMRLKGFGVFAENRRFPADEIERMLSEPLTVFGRQRRYRFPKQRATRIAAAMTHLQAEELRTLSDLEFRSWLADLPGVGPKTASWITRNWRRSNEVAILDIHVLRACWYIGLFELDIKLPRDYGKLEKRFLEFARILGSRPSVLDAVMWDDMRAVGSRLARPFVPR